LSKKYVLFLKSGEVAVFLERRALNQKAGAKVLLFFDMCKFFVKKSDFFAYIQVFLYLCTRKSI